MLKLKSLLTEAPGDDIAKIAGAGLAQSVSMLKKLASDPDMQGLLAKGAEDGKPTDEVVKFSQGSIPCTKMFPTQAEIGFGNSLDDLCKNQPWRSAVQAAFKSPVLMPSKPDNVPVLAAKVGGKIFILDGHHRWSLCFMINRNAKMVCDRYILDKVVGTHAIGHARMATESGVDIKSAHPFWGYPFSDVSVVHNGQLTNYWNNRRLLENKGMRFMSECDSELIAVYIAQKMREGASLEEGMRDSLTGLDGVFTYFVATKDSLGMAKDTMAAKPLVLYESDDLVAMGSEEIAIRSVLPQEIDTYDPFDGEVKVWQI